MIKTVKLENIMSHTNTTYNFPKTGIVRITGENSNGKSVLTKVLYDTLIEPSLHILKKRKNLVRHNCSYGELKVIFYPTDESEPEPELIVHIAQEISQTYYKYSKNTAPIYVDRQLQAIKQLCLELGFVQLNIYKSLKPLPFATTSGTDNYNHIRECTSDYNVECAIEVLEEKLKGFIEAEKELASTIITNKGKLSMLPQYDINTEFQFYNKTSKLLKILEVLVNAPEISQVHLPVQLPMPKTVYVQIPPLNKLQLPNMLPTPMYIEKTFELPKLNTTWSTNLQQLNNYCCPTCGRYFEEV